MDTKETEDFPEALDEDLMKRTFEGKPPIQRKVG